MRWSGVFGSSGSSIEVYGMVTGLDGVGVELKFGKEVR
jgi:hypothetical protein